MIFVRAIRVILVTVLCIALFAAIIELMMLLPYYLFPPDSIKDVSAFRRTNSPLSALAWGLFFRGPAYLLWGAVPLLSIFTVLEFHSIKSRWIYLGIWIAAAFLATYFTTLIATSLSGAIVGYIYWLLAGRTAGKGLQARRSGDAVP
jgi:hypothetical protein